jgi:ABC-type Fe3+ transport system permease subunit
METVWSGLSLLMMLALVGVLVFLSRRAGARQRRHGHGRHGAGPGAGGSGKAWGYTTLGYAFSTTFGAALFLASGLSGYRLDKRERFFADARWSHDYLWPQIWMGVVFACVAVYCWRKGLRDLRSNVYVPELAGRDASAPPSRRIERR